MTAHRVQYEGPKALAVKVATLLADAEGVELKSAGAPQPGDDAEAGLTLTVEGTPEAVQSAVDRIQAQLAGEARLTVL